MRRIDTVKRLSKSGDGLRLNAEGTARQSRNQNERAEEHAEKWRRKIFNAENTEECRETQSGKVAERNSLNAEAQRGKVSNQRGKSRRAVKKMEAKRFYRGGTTYWPPKR